MNRNTHILKISAEKGKLIVTGDLDGSYEANRVLRNALDKARKSGAEWVIDAAEMRLTTDGECAWVSAVHEFLSTCRLRYLPSQLATVLEYDDDYKHAHTRFLEEYPATSNEAAAICV